MSDDEPRALPESAECPACVGVQHPVVGRVFGVLIVACPLAPSGLGPYVPAETP